MTDEEVKDKIQALVKEFSEDNRDHLSEVLKVVSSAVHYGMEKELLMTIVKGIVTRREEIQQELLKMIEKVKEHNKTKSN